MGSLSCLLAQVQERPKALQAEVALTLKVWENMTDSALATILDQPLHTLSHIHSQLQTCVSPGSLAPPHCAFSHLGFPCVPAAASQSPSSVHRHSLSPQQSPGL